ncbi:MAG: hypothetical protein DME87_05115 [Verrucomicrobia bacterium]|nr:MAG: hypothetical protein DME87_05115 [Verrucomicrobiota bacterium]
MIKSERVPQKAFGSRPLGSTFSCHPELSARRSAVPGSHLTFKQKITKEAKIPICSYFREPFVPFVSFCLICSAFEAMNRESRCNDLTIQRITWACP